MEDASRHKSNSTVVFCPPSPPNVRKACGEVWTRVPFGVGFILLLMLVGGVAAYWGDHVGMLVGKKRLTILGLRPKYTSRVIAIGTGVLIVLFTLTTLLIVSNSVRQALFGMDELQGRVIELSAEVHAYEERRILLEERNEELLTRSLELEAETDQLEREKAELLVEVAHLENQVVDVRRQLESAREQLDSLEKSLELVRFFGAHVWNALETLYEAEFAVHVGDVVHTFLVDLTEGSDVAIAQIQAGIDRAEQVLIQRGFTPTVSGRIVRLDRTYNVDGDVVSFTAEEVLSQAVQTLMQWSQEGLESVIVQLAAVSNARLDDSVFVDFRFVIDQVVFPKGALLGARLFDPSTSTGKLLEEMMTFLQRDIGGVARASLLPLDGNYGQVTLVEAYEIVEKIKQHDSMVEVQVLASKDIWSHEPLAVEIRLSSTGKEG